MDFNISFKGLNNGELTNSDAYQQLADGIEYGEITPDLMQSISKDIVETFGQICPDACATFSHDNMAMETWFNREHEVIDNNLSYNTDFVYDLGQQYGQDAIVGAISHEMGHQIVNEIFSSSGLELSSWHKEFCSDYIAGISTRLSDLSSEPMCNFYSEQASESSESHPGGDLRIEAFNRGYEWASNIFNNTFADFTLSNSVTLKQMLVNDIIGCFPGELECNNISHDKNSLMEGSSGVTLTDPAEKDNIVLMPAEKEVSFKGGLGICNMKCLSGTCNTMSWKYSTSNPMPIDYSAGQQE